MRDSQAQCYISVTVVIELLEDVRHSLQRDARLNEKIEAHRVLASSIVGAEKDANELRAKTVAKSYERVAELVIGNVAAAIGIKAVEKCSPGSEKAPKAAVRA